MNLAGSFASCDLMEPEVRAGWAFRNDSGFSSQHRGSGHCSPYIRLIRASRGSSQPHLRKEGPGKLMDFDPIGGYTGDGLREQAVDKLACGREKKHLGPKVSGTTALQIFVPHCQHAGIHS